MSNHSAIRKSMKKQRRPRVEPFRHRVIDDPVLYAKKCKEVTDAIHKFFVGDYDLVFEDLYRTAYDCVLNRCGEELYSAVEAALASGAQDLGRALDAVLDGGGGGDDDALFLRELLDKWNQHRKAVIHTRDVLMYMDRTHVPTHKKTPIHELGLRLWRDIVIRSEKVWPRLMDIVMRSSGGASDEEEDAAASSVPDDLKSMLKELGGEVYIPRI